MAIMSSMGTGPFPEFGAKSIELFSIGQQLKVKLTVVLKERGDKYVKWFTKSSKKNLYLKIIQTTDVDAASTVLTEKTIVSTKELKTQDTKTKKEKIINIQAALSEMGLKFNTAQLQKFFVRQDIGGKLYEIPLEFEFMVDGLNPSNLQYFFIPKIVGSLYQNSEPGILAMSKKINPLIKREVVLEEGKIPATSKAYLLTNGGTNSVWTGAVHFMNSEAGVMAGVSHTKSSQYLSVGTVTNLKIKDYRVLKQMSNISFSKPILASAEFKPSIFSEIYLSRTYYDTTTGCFSVNINNLLKKYISFSNHFNDNGIDLKDFALFKTLRLMRRKVEIANGEVTPVGKHIVVREFKNPDQAMAGGNSDNKFSTINNIFDDMKSNKLIKTFDFHDEFEQAEGSFYQYGIEGSIIDLTSNKIGGMIKKLSKRIQELKKLKIDAQKNYNYNSKCYNFKYINLNSSNKVLSAAVKDLLVTLTLGTGPLDIKRTARFFYNTCSSVSGSPDGIEKLINILMQISSKLQNFTKQYKSKKPGVSAGFPQKSNKKAPKNIKEIKFMHYFKDVVASDSTYYGYEYLSSGKKLSNVVGETGVAPINYLPSRLVKRNEFLNRVNLETEKYFISDTANNANDFSNALVPIAGGGSLNPNDSVEGTKYAFLTPAVIKMAQIKVKQKETPGGEKKQLALIFNSYDDKPIFDNLNIDISKIDTDAYNDVISKIVKYNKIKKILSEKGSNQKQCIDASIKEFFGDEGVTITASQKSEKKNFAITKSESKKEKGVGLIKKNLLKKPKIKNSLFMFSIAANSYLDYNKDNMSLYDINSPASAISKPKFAPDPSKEQVTKAIKILPNQTKSLMFNMMNSGLVKKTNLGNIDSSLNSAKNFGAYYMNYKNLVIIEYLSGYELDNTGNPNPKKGIWKALDLARMSNGKIQNTLCRMNRYELKNFNIKKTNLLELPIYDKYFKIVNENFSQTQQLKGLQTVSPQQEEIMNNIEKALNPNSGDLLGGNVKIMPEDTSTL